MSRAAGVRGALGLALGLAVCLLAACQTPPPLPPPLPLTHAQIVREQLTLILATQHPSCGEVQRYGRQERLDYRVECASGERFRVRVSGDGRVLVTPATAP
jgi:hypothetical protein